MKISNKQTIQVRVFPSPSTPRLSLPRHWRSPLISRFTDCFPFTTDFPDFPRFSSPQPTGQYKMHHLPPLPLGLSVDKPNLNVIDELCFILQFYSLYLNTILFYWNSFLVSCTLERLTIFMLHRLLVTLSFIFLWI